MPLKRSDIELSIQQALAAFRNFGIALPPYAYWTIDDWRKNRSPQHDPIVDCMIGWDATDFGSGRFHEVGRTLFTARNGKSGSSKYPKPYAQKYLFDPDDQRAPAHFHRSKMEDICCLAGGNILVQVRAAAPDDTPDERPLTLQVDGIIRTVAAGEIIRLRPGQSVCLPPRTIHQFWGEKGTCPTVSMEVSSVCDDWNDNVFLEPAARFPEIQEDVTAQYVLCNEYARVLGQ